MTDHDEDDPENNERQRDRDDGSQNSIDEVTTAAFGHVYTNWIVDTAKDVQQRLIADITRPMRTIDTGWQHRGLANIVRFAPPQPRVSDFFVDLAKRVTVGPSQTGLTSSMLASDPKWFQQYVNTGIDSDIFKSYALVQPNLTAITSRLFKAADFGQGISSNVLDAYTKQQLTWLRDIADDMERIRRGFYPSNLHGIGGLTFELVEEVVMVDGIALYGVPRTSVAEALLHADGAAKRRDILGRRWKQISADCRDFAESIAEGDLRNFGLSVIASLDALDVGNNAAAQALAATVVDSVLRRHVDKRHSFMPDRKGTRTTAAYDELNFRMFIAFAPIWQAYQQFNTDKDDPIPTVFSRHASAHTVSRKQFNRRNAVQGILLACGLLCWLDEQAVAQAA